jgi:DNA-binding transcriptional ArsR family regulator
VELGRYTFPRGSYRGRKNPVDFAGAILSRLAAGPATVGELAGPFHMSQQAISKHLAYLERARLIEKRSEGRSHVCTLRPAPFKEVSELVEHYRVFWEQALHRLEAYIRATGAEEKKHGHKQRG